MNIAAVGTSISFAKFLFLPKSTTVTAPDKVKTLWPAMVVLLGGLLVANGFYPKAYALDSILKALGTIAVGWALYWGVIKRVTVKLPRMFEQLEHLIGVMSLSAIGLFLLAIHFATPGVFQ